MRYTLLTLLLSSFLLGAVWELGGGGGLVILDRSISGDYLQGGDENLPRFFLRGGYQLTSRSDQIALSLSSDKRIDEVALDYNWMLPGGQSFAPFGALPYLKLGLGLGNTHADGATLSHLGGALGLGLLGRSTERLRMRFELEYRMREGQLERRGEEPDGEIVSWQDQEINFLIGLGLTF